MKAKCVPALGSRTARLDVNGTANAIEVPEHASRHRHLDSDTALTVPGESGAFPNRWSIIVETLATLGMGMVLLAWLWGFSALLFRKPRSN